ncbi:MAG TPA: DUF2911 domain-containing protein [Longimicrobiales bacterium]|nr:DUF2911 domain-containing protein [Longimicrobiales bacterium]
MGWSGPGLSAAILLMGALLFSPAVAVSQVVQSERATMSQTIDGTTISFDYGRPRMKGRGEVIEDVVHIGDHRWTPGADWATILTADRPFYLNGERIPDGRWSVWIDLEPDEWTLVLNPVDSIFHYPAPPDHPDQIELPLSPREGDFVESLLFWIPETRMLGFDLLLSWGRTEIPFEVQVDPTFETVVERSVGEELVGSYTIRDPDADPDEGARFDVFWEGDHLAVSTLRGPSGPELQGWLIPRGEGFYWFGEVRDGAVFDIEVDILLEVVRDDQGQTLGFDARWADDSVIARVRRAVEPGRP